jgi:hypothetical protein
LGSACRRNHELADGLQAAQYRGIVILRCLRHVGDHLREQHEYPDRRDQRERRRNDRLLPVRDRRVLIVVIVMVVVIAVLIVRFHGFPMRYGSKRAPIGGACARRPAANALRCGPPVKASNYTVTDGARPAQVDARSIDTVKSASTRP